MWVKFSQKITINEFHPRKENSERHLYSTPQSLSEMSHNSCWKRHHTVWKKSELFIFEDMTLTPSIFENVAPKSKIDNSFIFEKDDSNAIYFWKYDTSIKNHLRF